MPYQTDQSNNSPPMYTTYRTSTCSNSIPFVILIIIVVIIFTI